MKDISKLISKITSPILKKKGIAFSTLMEDWDQLIPAEHQGMVMPKSLAFPKGDTRHAKLTILVPNHSVALYFQYAIPLVTERINQHFGYPVVKDIILKADSEAFTDLPQPQKQFDSPIVKKSSEPFDSEGLDDSLREALEGLQDVLR